MRRPGSDIQAAVCDIPCNQDAVNPGNLPAHKGVRWLSRRRVSFSQEMDDVLACSYLNDRIYTLPKGVSTSFSWRSVKISGLSRPVPPIIPICCGGSPVIAVSDNGMAHKH